MNSKTNTKIRLILMNFLEFAVWGAYLTSQGRYLGSIGLGPQIGWFFSIQGIVSIFMPALMGIIADKWIPAQKLLGLCHLLAGAFMIMAGVYGIQNGSNAEFGPLFTLYALSIAFFMPTIALTNSVSYNALEKEGMDTVKDFPPIRVFGTIGFIISMWVVDLLGYMDSPVQYAISGMLSLVLGVYAFTLPKCPINKSAEKKSLVDAMGLRAFTLFKDSRMAIFFIFSMLLGVALQITNSFANPFMGDFRHIPEFAETFGVKHSGMLISLSQVSETLCILLIPFFLKKFGIKKVMLISMFAWVLRFAFFGLGDPGSGVWLFVLSMIVYGVAFDFFNISGSLFVDQNTDVAMRSSAQGLFMLMTNGLGAAVGTLGAQAIVNHFVNSHSPRTDIVARMAGWDTCWYIFAAYALVIAVVFAIIFKYKHTPETSKK